MYIVTGQKLVDVKAGRLYGPDAIVRDGLSAAALALAGTSPHRPDPDVLEFAGSGGLADRLRAAYAAQARTEAVVEALTAKQASGFAAPRPVGGCSADLYAELRGSYETATHAVNALRRAAAPLIEQAKAMVSYAKGRAGSAEGRTR